MAWAPRLPDAEDWREARPVYVVWELTLACDQRCGHCGSRAGRKRPSELSHAEALDLVDQLAALGTREITLIGGEAYLRLDWVEIVGAIAGRGILPTLQTGGRGLTRARLEAAKEAGLGAVGVSIDGLDEAHDALRGVPGSAAAAWGALESCRSLGIPTTVNTTVTRATWHQLEEMFARVVSSGARTWQVGIDVAMGRAADHPDQLLQPYELLELVPRLGALARAGREQGVLLMPGNTVGYFGPDEALLRQGGDERVHWTGCNAGRNSMGIESDGTIKACPSLPRQGYAGGSVRERPVGEIWAETAPIRFLRTRTVEDLWGFCRTCVYAADCLAGCAWVSHSFLGRPGNNPYCHHRALALHAEGLRERVERQEAPPGEPFDLGRFQLSVERLDGSDPRPVTPPPWSLPEPEGRAERPVPRRLRRCPACGLYTDPEVDACGRCGRSLAEAEAHRAGRLARAQEALARLRGLLGEVG